MRELNPTQTTNFDRRAAEDLAASLRKRIQGEVRFDNGSRAIYSTDSSNYRQVPIGVVIPKVVDDVLETLEIARRFGAPILARGGGTSLAGQCCNAGIVIDMSKYLNRIIEIDPLRRIARVQPGVVLDQLNKVLKPYNVNTWHRSSKWPLTELLPVRLIRKVVTCGKSALMIQSLLLPRRQ